MRVLLTGANGFIGKYLLAELQRRGHEVVPAVRNPEAMDRILGEQRSINADFNRDTSPDIWVVRLKGIDAVINCAGILQTRPGQSIDSIHVAGPRALFEACRIAGIRRVLQISAISASPRADTPYSITKALADDNLRQSDLDWTIFKPSLVVAPGAYGGTSLLRALAALPFFTPIVGRGGQEFRPIDMADLTALVCDALTSDDTVGRSLLVVGPDTVTLTTILTDFRRWLGYSPARKIHVPIRLVSFMARIGDIFGGTINTTALRQLRFGNAARDVEEPDEILVTRTGWHAILRAYPAQVQDRWHARLYAVRPILRIAIGLAWIVSGIVAFLQPIPPVGKVLAELGLGTLSPNAVIAGTGLLDIVIGAAVWMRWRPRAMASVQILVVAVYTAALSFAVPGLWLEALGPLLKNIPFVAAVLALAAIEVDR